MISKKSLGAILMPIFLWSFGVSGKVGAMTLSHLSGPLYLVEDEHYTRTNSLVYLGPDFVTVVGATWTPDTASLLAQQIRELTNRSVREVVDTSPDPEWSGGNAYWQSIGAKVVAAHVTCTFLADNWDATVVTTRKYFPSYPILPLSPPTECNPDKFDLQGGKIQVFYLGPSHTEADVFVYFPEQKVLDAGSILKEKLGNLAKANLEEYPRTLHKLQALHLDIKTVIAGHWSPIHGPELIDTYLSLLAQQTQDSDSR